jgi:hypothetical protein
VSIAGVAVWPEEPWSKRQWLRHLAGMKEFKLDEVEDGVFERLDLSRVELNEWRMEWLRSRKSGGSSRSW